MRAGILEQGTVDVLRAAGAGERTDRGGCGTTASNCASTGAATASPPTANGCGAGRSPGRRSRPRAPSCTSRCGADGSSRPSTPAHIAPPADAKGLNPAVGDVVTFARALTRRWRPGSTGLLDACSKTCLRRVWQAERFSYAMTTLLRRAPDATTAFQDRLRLARLERIASSRAAETDLAEAHTGFPLH
ncbi:hypothetical protein GCM10020295_49930 [Streptomyces cinereospinus]